MIIGFIIAIIVSLTIGFFLGHHVGVRDTVEIYEERMARMNRERKTLEKTQKVFDRYSSKQTLTNE